MYIHFCWAYYTLLFNKSGFISVPIYLKEYIIYVHCTMYLVPNNNYNNCCIYILHYIYIIHKL